MEAKHFALAAITAAAIALYIAMGGDGRGLEDHARWMASAKDSGAWVMW